MSLDKFMWVIKYPTDFIVQFQKNNHHRKNVLVNKVTVKQPLVLCASCGTCEEEMRNIHTGLTRFY